MSRIVAVTASTVPEGEAVGFSAGSRSLRSVENPATSPSIPRVRVNVAYIAALKNAGLIPVVIPPLSEEHASVVLDGVAGLVLTGGEDVDPAFYGDEPHPKLGEINRERDESELSLIKEAKRRRLPTLAICRGIQILNVALGGTLIQDIPSRGGQGGRGGEAGSALSHSGPRDKRTHDISIDPDSLAGVTIGAATISVNSAHHQSIDKIAPGLRVTAKASDGIIEAVEPVDKNWWMLGVQWHPEELVNTPESWDREIFRAFATRANGAL